MSGGGSEVSKKIRAAIKAKLEELGAYVDEELPDYIMVMIANKKTKAQMKEDLQLFLGKNAAKFVDWLFEIFERLQAANKASSESSAEKSSKKKTKEKSKKKEKEKSTDEASKKGHRRKKERPATALPDSQKHTHSLTAQQSSNKKKLEDNAEKSEAQTIETDERSVAKETTVVETEQLADEVQVEDQLQMHAESVGDAIDEEIWLAGGEARREESVRRRRISPPASSPSAASKRNVVRVQPMRQERPHSHVQQRPTSRQTGDGGQQLASVVALVGSSTTDSGSQPQEAAQQQKSSAPLTTLFAKALHEAAKQPSDTRRKRHKDGDGVEGNNKSSEEDEQERRHERKRRRAKSGTESRRQTRRKVELSTEQPTASKHKSAQESETKSKSSTKFVITMSGLSDSFHKKMEDGETPNDAAQPKKHKLVKVQKAYSPPPKPKIVKHMPEQKSVRPVKLKLAHRKGSQKMDDQPSPPPGDGEEIEKKEESSDEGEPIPVLVDTRQVVTKGGQFWSAQINPVSISLDDDQEDEDMEAVLNGKKEEMEEERSVSANSQPPPPKLMERCKFWPACRQADSCPYVHPTKHCLTFPKCPYADRCIYIHPNCKYDQTCTRLSCPYTHAGKRAATQKFISHGSKSTSSSSYVPRQNTFACRFGPKCTNVRCTYQHPKPCHYGAECLNATCTFLHPKKSGSSEETAKYKWSAQTNSQDCM